MIKERLKYLDIKITELANYLQISRTTLYKFIDAYDSGNKKEINNHVKKLFDYIEKNELIGKKNVINYIFNNMAIISENDTLEVNQFVKNIKEYISENPTSEKTQFINQCVNTTQFDIVIHYLMEINLLFKKRKLSDVEEKKLKPYLDIIDLYKMKGVE